MPVLGDTALTDLTPEAVREWFVGMGSDRLGHTTSSAAMRYQHVAAGRADTLAARLSAFARVDST